jgi:hypothetical protein
VPNLVIAPVNAAGQVEFYNGGTDTTHLIADVFGYINGGPASAGGSVVSVAPSRVLDTRSGVGASGPVGAGDSLTLKVAGVGSVPAGVSAVILNVTVTQPAGFGYVSVFAPAAQPPTASNLNYVQGQTVPNLVIAPVNAAGQVEFYNGGTDTTHLIADVFGYVLSPDTTPPGPVTAVNASPASTSVTLSWTNPSSADFAGVMIRRAVGGTPPASTTAGTLVTDTSAAATAYTDSGLAPGTQYSYALFAHDAIPNYAAAAKKTISTSASGVIAVSTAAQLTAALAAAQPGQTIQLADGTYVGNFAASTSGTAALPIRLVGTRNAVLQGKTTSSGYVMHLDGASYWTLQGFSMTGASKGLVLDGASHDLVDGVDVGNVGEEAVHFRAFSSDNTIQNSVVHDTGLVDPQYGEGVYIGSALSNWINYSNGNPDLSNGNQVLDNDIHDVTAEAVDLKEGTIGGAVSGNTLGGAAISGENFADSFIAVQGNNFTISDNTLVHASSAILDGFQTHEKVDGDGSGNIFSGNVVQDTAFPGYEINIDTKTANTVSCSNQPGGAVLGRSNIACT